ncbi:flagellin FlaB [Methanococcus maripaludis]|uniref:Flagellin n=1 Tax=Methanococcus maripaludis TaxID=39152 RepID=A0A7J9P2D1_METMI|nr:flagellin [Methanococcus maripaludis]MBA2857361.1 flagellin FlaB [Methanococcus maripaludis]
MKITEFMKSKKGASGIGTLIVFIAMVLVAAVAASVLINTSGYLQQKASTTGKESTDQVASGLQVDGVTGFATSTLDNMVIYVTPNAGSAAIDLKETKIFVTYDGKNQVLSYNGVLADSDDGDIFSAGSTGGTLAGAQATITRGGDRITLVVNGDVAATYPDGTSVTLTAGTVPTDTFGVSTTYVGKTGVVIGNSVYDGSTSTTIVIALTDLDATVADSNYAVAAQTITLNGNTYTLDDTIALVNDVNQASIIELTAGTAGGSAYSALGLSDGDTVTVSLTAPEAVSATGTVEGTPADNSLVIHVPITAVTKDYASGAVTGSLSGVWPGVDDSSFKIIVLQGTVTDGVIDKGDLVGVAVNTNAIFGGIPNRMAVSAKIQPEFGAPGIVSFTTPATYSTSIVELQ